MSSVEVQSVHSVRSEQEYEDSVVLTVPDTVPDGEEGTNGANSANDNGDGDGVNASEDAESAESDSCSICCEEISTAESETLSCGHRFHKRCIEQWVNNSDTCPLCRAVITNDIASTTEQQRRVLATASRFFESDIGDTMLRAALLDAFMFGLLISQIHVIYDATSFPFILSVLAGVCVSVVRLKTPNRIRNGSISTLRRVGVMFERIMLMRTFFLLLYISLWGAKQTLPQKQKPYIFMVCIVSSLHCCNDTAALISARTARSTLHALLITQGLRGASIQ